MSITTPNEIYYKSRRFTVASSALLLLAIYVGISLGESGTDPSGTLFSLKLKNPDSLPTVFLWVALYSIWQFLAAWYVQTQEVRGFWVNIVDCLFTGAIALFAMASFYDKFPARESWIILLVSLGLWCVICFFGTQKLKAFFAKKTKKKDSDLFSILISKDWKLFMNPQFPEKFKTIKFLDNGNIEDNGIAKGKNNETTWRVREGLLEILNSEGKIFSRFRYNKAQDIFEHTNDDDTLSIRHQVIRPLASLSADVK